MATFEKPSFLGEETLEKIHRRMISSLPTDMDVSEGSHPWNLTMPSAYEIAQLTEFVIPEVIKILFPQFCEDYGEMLDYHAQARGMERKAAQRATGVLKITGDIGAEIPAGSTFSTVSNGDINSVDFETLEACTIDVNREAEAKIRAVDAGTGGNVGANTIVLNSDAVAGIAALTNPAATAGGMDEETNASLQKRILERDQSGEVSYGGTIHDYKRWAEEVEGVGSATIVTPADDTGVVKIYLLDANGDPASDEICDSVYSHIMAPSNPQERLAPINDQISVVKQAVINAKIAATVTIATGWTADAFLTAIKAALKDYATQAQKDGKIKYSKVGAMIESRIEADSYADLTINGGTVDIAVDAGAYVSFDISQIKA